MRAPVLALAVALCASMRGADRTADLDNLYQSSQWFAFRDAVLQGPAPGFYRGELALAFHDWAQAEKELSAVMKSGASSGGRSETDFAQAFEAGLGLLKIDMLSGRYRDARAVLSRMEQSLRSSRNTQPIAPVFHAMFSAFRAALEPLSGYPDQAVVAQGAHGARSRLLYAEVDNQLIVPLLINGRAANYSIDTGAEASVMSAAEARRLGLTVHPVSASFSTFGSHSGQATGVTVAADLVIGNFHLRNVFFLVTPDEDAGGLLGLPLLLAFQTLRWGSDGILEFGYPAQPRNLRESNLCLAGGLPLTSARIGNRSLVLGVDTGSYDTDLFPRFAQDFADLMRQPVAVGQRDIGNDAVDPNVTTLAEVELRVGGLRTRLSPAQVLSKDPMDDTRGVHGLMGMDLLGQARSVTLDLAAMKLTLDGIDAPAAAPAGTCALPPDFLCAPGWTCTVKATDGLPCFVDRVAATPWPGNPVDSEGSAAANSTGGAAGSSAGGATGSSAGGAAGSSAGGAKGNGASRCVLSPGAACPHGKLCRAVFDSNQSCRIAEESAPVAPGTPPAAPATTVRTAPATEPAARPTIPAAAAVDVREIVRRSLQFETLDLSPARDYVYLEDKEEHKLDAAGNTADTTTETREVLNLYGDTFERLIRKNGKDLPPDKARAEQARFDKAVDKRAHETPEAKAKREQAERKEQATDLACADEFLKAFEFRLAGTETVNGRAAWMVDAAPSAAPKAATTAQCGDVKMLARFRIKFWIDQAEYRWTRLEGDNFATVTWAKLLVRVPPGGVHIFYEQTRHEDGAWLPSLLQARMNAKVLLLAAFRVDVRFTYSGYHKFHAESRILPAPAGK